MTTATATESAIAFADSDPESTRKRLIMWQDPMLAASEGMKMAGIDYMHALMAGELPPPPIAVVMNMTPVEVDVGRAVFEGEPGEEHYNPIGVVHGGYAATMLDSALGCAVQTTLPAGVAYTTLTLETKFVRPITRETGIVRAEAEVVHRGRRQATVEARLVAAESDAASSASRPGAAGKLLAHASSTCMILELDG